MNSSKVVGWPSSKEQKKIGTQDCMHLSGEDDLVIVIQLKPKADPSSVKNFLLY